MQNALSVLYKEHPFCDTVGSPEGDHTAKLRQLIGLAFFSQTNDLRDELLSIEKMGDGSQLSLALIAFAKKLLGAPFEATHLNVERNPRKNAELGVLAAFLGKYEDALMLGQWQRKLLARDGTFFHALGLSEDEYDSLELTALNYLLFYLCSNLASDSTLALMAESQLDQLKKKDQAPSPYVLQLARFIDTALEGTHSAIPEVTEDKGVATYFGQNFSLACMANGKSTGIGAVYKGDVQIISFGPHFFPLGKMENFGIFRPFEGTHDIRKESEPFTYAFWSRLSDEGKPSDSWIDTEIKATDDQMEIKAKFLHFGEFKPHAFVFFVKADKTVVNKFHEIHPMSLTRYQDQTAPIQFNDGSLEIKPEYNGEMQIIPLAGKDYFWGANFLIAFATEEENQTYTWSIS